MRTASTEVTNSKEAVPFVFGGGGRGGGTVEGNYSLAR